MEPIKNIHNIEELKIIGDARRLAILKLLMSGQETLSSLGKHLGVHPARVRHHLKQLEGAGLVELTTTRIVRGFVEKYYTATAQAFMFTGLILPSLASPEDKAIVAIGSHDLALELLGRQFNQIYQGNRSIYSIPVGSLEGLVALRQGLAHVAGCHLLDIASGEYNLPYIRHFFPDRLVRLITLAHRQQGLLLSPGNPYQLHSLEDLVRENITLINRNKGSGTRLWLDKQLEALRIDPEQIAGYEQEARTHTQLAAAISQGKANAGIGLQASARQFELDFIPLFQERFDLVIPLEQLQNPGIISLLDYLSSGEFRQSVARMDGYNTVHSGELISP